MSYKEEYNRKYIHRKQRHHGLNDDGNSVYWYNDNTLISPLLYVFGIYYK